MKAGKAKMHGLVMALSSSATCIGITAAIPLLTTLIVWCCLKQKRGGKKRRKLP